MEGRHAANPAGRRGLDEVFRRAAKADEKVMVVGIHHRTPTLEIRKNGHGVLANPEFPALRVVTGRRKRRIADPLQPSCLPGARVALAVAPGPLGQSLVFHPRLAGVQRVPRDRNTGTRNHGCANELASRHHGDAYLVEPTLCVTCRVLASGSAATASQYAVRLTRSCTPGTGVNLWGESPL